jgi:hypothetical protein
MSTRKNLGAIRIFGSSRCVAAKLSVIRLQLFLRRLEMRETSQLSCGVLRTPIHAEKHNCAFLNTMRRAIPARKKPLELAPSAADRRRRRLSPSLPGSGAPVRSRLKRRPLPIKFARCRAIGEDSLRRWCSVIAGQAGVADEIQNSLYRSGFGVFRWKINLEF